MVPGRTCGGCDRTPGTRGPVPRRVALAVHAPWLGGAERCCLELAAGLVAAGEEVHALVPTPPGPRPLAGELLAAGAVVHDVPGRWWAREPGTPRRGLTGIDWAGVRAARGALRAVRPDVVVTGSLVHPTAAVAARTLGLPHVWWVQELGQRDHGYRLALGERGTLRAVAALSRRVVTLSATLARFVREGGVPAGRVRVIPPALAMPAAAASWDAGDHARPLRLVVCGRVRETKGQGDAVRVVAELATRGVEARLDVVADGELEALRALAASLGVADRVGFHGAVADPVPLLDAADIALTCSRFEAFGRVTAEAQLRGRCVVGAATGGTAELVEDGVTGLTYPPGDVDALADALARLHADPSLHAALARAGWERARASFRPEPFLSAWDAVLERAAA